MLACRRVAVAPYEVPRTTSTLAAMNDDLVDFFDRLAAAAGTARVDPAEVDAVLDLARVVAHSAERRYAPLATYAAALALPSDSAARDRAEHLRNVIAAVQQLTGNA